MYMFEIVLTNELYESLRIWGVRVHVGFEDE